MSTLSDAVKVIGLKPENFFPALSAGDYAVLVDSLGGDVAEDIIVLVGQAAWDDAVSGTPTNATRSRKLKRAQVLLTASYLDMYAAQMASGLGHGGSTKEKITDAEQWFERQVGLLADASSIARGFATRADVYLRPYLLKQSFPMAFASMPLRRCCTTSRRYSAWDRDPC